MKRRIYLLSPTPRAGTRHLPMIRFEQTADSIDFGDADTLLFTSKKAVAFADAIDPAWRTYDCLAVGEATAEAIEAHGGKVLYRPKEFYGKSLARDIVARFSQRKLLYLRPKRVSFDAKTFLQHAGIAVREQVIYQTSCIAYGTQDAPPPGSIIVFTSPSTIRCFLQNFTWDASYSAVVIGEATKVHLPDGARYAVAKKPRIAACIAKAEEILRNSNAK